MRRALILAALVLAFPCEPAAACHRYRVWHYPSPQRCSVAVVRPVDRSWSVEITGLPEGVTRDLALDQLREKLKAQ